MCDYVSKKGGGRSPDPLPPILGDVSVGCLTPLNTDNSLPPRGSNVHKTACPVREETCSGSTGYRVDQAESSLVPEELRSGFVSG